jgi:hypothetical protein
MKPQRKGSGSGWLFFLEDFFIGIFYLKKERNGINNKPDMEMPGIDPGTSRMLSKRSTI